MEKKSTTKEKRIWSVTLYAFSDTKRLIEEERDERRWQNGNGTRSVRGRPNYKIMKGFLRDAFDGDVHSIIRYFWTRSKTQRLQNKRHSQTSLFNSDRAMKEALENTWKKGFFPNPYGIKGQRINSVIAFEVDSESYHSGDCFYIADEAQAQALEFSVYSHPPRDIQRLRSFAHKPLKCKQSNRERSRIRYASEAHDKEGVLLEEFDTELEPEKKKRKVTYHDKEVQVNLDELLANVDDKNGKREMPISEMPPDMWQSEATLFSPFDPPEEPSLFEEATPEDNGIDLIDGSFVDDWINSCSN